VIIEITDNYANAKFIAFCRAEQFRRHLPTHRHFQLPRDANLVKR